MINSGAGIAPGEANVGRKQMIMLRASIAITMLAMIAGCTTIHVTDDIAVSHPDFWVDMAPASTNGHLVSTTRFAWKKHQFYGWSLRVHTTRTNSTWFAIYQYPHPTDHLRELGPTNYWGEVTEDMSRVITHCEPLPKDGRIGAVCVLMPGEPAGYYSVIAFVDYVPVYTFRYEIYETN